MAREIKFRIWDKEQKKLLKDEAEFWDIAPIESYGINEDITDLQKEGKTFLQYTGLKDKSGKEIYEGDIVYLEDIDSADTGNYRISWEESGYFTLRPFIDPEGYVPTLGYFTDENLNDGYYTIEVIGNIYENPALLEGK